MRLPCLQLQGVALLVRDQGLQVILSVSENDLSLSRRSRPELEVYLGFHQELRNLECAPIGLFPPFLKFLKDLGYAPFAPDVRVPGPTGSLT